MIVQCADCNTRYELDPARVPRQEIRVRCPKCRYVFAVDGRTAEEPMGAGAAANPARGAAATTGAGYREIELRSGPVSTMEAPAPPVAPPVSRVPESAPVASAAPAAAPAPQADQDGFDLEIERSAPPTRAAQAPAAPAAPQPVAAAAPAAPSAPAAGAGSAGNPESEKARRLARALVSDILVYNRDQRDAALREGNLVQALGQEIKKSWELYKEKVSPEVANSTNHFREALNEILADGQQIF